MRIRVNHWCNVLTDNDSKSYCSPRPGSKPAPEITIPSFSKRLSVDEARQLGEALLEAVRVAEGQKP